jgi:hypothetical protein
LKSNIEIKKKESQSRNGDQEARIIGETKKNHTKNDEKSEKGEA